MHACTGDLICFVDSDDWLAPDMIEKMVACLCENGADAAMCGFVDYPHGAPVKKGVFPVQPCGFSGTVYQMLRRDGSFTSLWAKLFKRELVFRDGQFISFNPDLAYGEDEVWLLQVLQRSIKTAFLPQALYNWRPRAGSVTRADTVDEKQLSILASKKRALSLLPDDPKIRTLARSRIYNDCFSLKTRAYCTNDRETFQTVSRAIRPMRRDFLRSPEFLSLRKCKLLVLNAEMRLGLPAGLVKKTDALTHGFR